MRVLAALRLPVKEWGASVRLRALEPLVLGALVWLLVVVVSGASVECDLHEVCAGWFGAKLEVMV